MQHSCPIYLNLGRHIRKPAVVQKGEWSLTYPSQLKKLIHIEISTEGKIETIAPADSLSDETISINIENNEKPEINQYWEISNSKDSLSTYVSETDSSMIQLFKLNTSRSDTYGLNDVKFEVLPEDFVRKVKDPHLVAVGRSRVNYVF